MTRGFEQAFYQQAESLTPEDVARLYKLQSFKLKRYYDRSLRNDISRLYTGSPLLRYLVKERFTSLEAQNRAVKHEVL